MSDRKRGNQGQAEDPTPDESGPVLDSAPSPSGPENPDAAGVESLSLEDEQRTILAESGAHDDLIALRDAVEATLLGRGGAEAAVSAYSEPDNAIVGVGIGLADPGHSAGMSVPGEPALILYTVNELPQEELIAQLAQSAGTRALSTLAVQQSPVGVIDAFSHRARRRPAPGGARLAM